MSFSTIQNLDGTIAECATEYYGTRYNHETYKDNSDSGDLFVIKQLPKGTTRIASFAFENYPIRSIVIPATVQSMGAAVFRGCKDLSNVKFEGNSVINRLDDSIFRDCLSLKKINIPISVVSIGDYSFSGCNNLRQIMLPNNLEEIGDYAFSGCYSLESIVIPASVKHIGSFAFAGCSSLKEITFLGDDVCLGISAFSSCTSLTEFTFPSKITKIPDGVLSYCESLIKIVIPETVDTIGPSAFRGCKALLSINLPEGLANLASSTFRGCKSLECIKLPSSLKMIGIGAFYSCEKLKQISLPKSLTNIEDNAFFRCISLNKVSLPSRMDYLGWGAFAMCESLEAITLPSKPFEHPSSYENCYSGDEMNFDQMLPIFAGCSKLEMTGVKNANSLSVDPEWFFEGRGNEKSEYERVCSVNIANVFHSNWQSADKHPTTPKPDAPHKLIVPENMGRDGSLDLDTLDDYVAKECPEGNAVMMIPGCYKRISSYDVVRWEQVNELVLSNGVEDFTPELFEASIVRYVFPKSLKHLWLQVDGFDKYVSVVLNGTDAIIEDGSFRGVSEVHLKHTLPIKSIHKLFIDPRGTFGDTYHELSAMVNCTLYVPKGCKYIYQQIPEYELFKQIIEE